MARWIVALVCCLALTESTLYGAQHQEMSAIPADAVEVTAQRPLLRSALLQASQAPLRSEASSLVQASGGDERNWIQRHPVLTGALMGFGAGFTLAFAAAENNQHTTSMSPAASALLYGSASGAVGALIGWGVERSRDDNDPDYMRSAAIR
jgi:hypothetical protein